MKRASQTRSAAAPDRRLATVVDGLDDARCGALSAEIDPIVSGRIRDIRLTGRLSDLYRSTSWRQRSRIARGWLIWAMVLSIPMVALDWLCEPRVAPIAFLMRGPFMVGALSAVAWIWAHPRPDWVEGASLPAVAVVLLIIAEVIGQASSDGVTHLYLAAAVFATSTAVVIFPVTPSATIAGAVMAVGGFIGVGLSHPTLPANVTIAFGVFFALVFGTLVMSRRTMTIIQQHSFLLNLRGCLQTRALAAANARLAILANTDALTGLANRRSYEDEANRLWADASEPPCGIAIVLFDIDHFKRLNDTAGHAVGDRCLVAIAGEIRRVLPARDFCARYGGEEFICLLRDATPRVATDLAETLRAAVEALSLPNPGTGGCVTVSLGIAVATPDRRPRSLVDLVMAADAALYRAKAGGRNRVAAAWDASPPAFALEPASRAALPA